MKLTKFAIERPVTTTMLFIALAFFGIMAYMNVGVNMMPKVNSPSIMVTTVLPGATPEELEKNVTEKIEKEVSGLSNLKRVISYSMENVSTVQAEFRSSKNENEAMNEVKEKVELAMAEMPQSIERPLIQKTNIADAPVLSIVMSGNRSGKELYDLADNKLRSQLMNEIKSCTTDFKDIVFNEPFEGFGDSPDFYVYGFDGKVIALGEIKCPMSQGKIESLQFGNTIDEKDEYYWQFLGHFLGRPDVDKLYYVIYDGYTNEGRILEMNRADHVDNIKKLYDRIRLASEMVDESIRSGLDLLDCVDKAKEVLDLKLQIESLKPEAKNSVPVKNQIYKLRKELRKQTKKVPSQH